MGHAHPELRSAALTQLESAGGDFAGADLEDATARLAEVLAPVVPVRAPRLLLAPDPPAAVSQAVECAFRYWRSRLDRRRTALLTLGGAAHFIDPHPYEVLRTAGYSERDWLEQGLAALRRHEERLAAVVIEPLVQAAAGLQVADPAAVAAFADAVQARGIPLICDEVATGFGRTGTLFASEQCLINPDLVCLGHSITSGHLPLSATVVASEIYERPPPSQGELSPHHRLGVALACAVAVRHLEILSEPAVFDHVAEMSEHLRAVLAAVVGHGAVAGMRGRGLMVAVDLGPRSPASAEGVCAAARTRGVLLLPLGEVIAITPPLSITRSEIDAIGGALLGALHEVCGSPGSGLLGGPL